MFTGRKYTILFVFVLMVIASGCGVYHTTERTTPLAAIHGSEDLPLLARRFAPWLRLNTEEPHHVEAVVAVFHPDRPTIGYHVFFSGDVVRPHGGERYDHEIIWVTYDAITLKITDVATYWHRTVLRTDECVAQAQLSSQRPIVDVQWGQHGMLPFGWRSLRTARPFVELKVHYNLVRHTDIDLFPNDVEPVAFNGSYEDYVEFTKVVDLADFIDDESVAVNFSPRVTFRGRVAGNFAEKKNWPDQ